MLHCLLTDLPLKGKIESLPEDEALCLGVVGGSSGLGFGEPGGLQRPQALVRCVRFPYVISPSS